MKCTRQQQNLFFDQKRKEGMYEYNMKAMACDNELMREREPKNEDKLRICSSCHGFFSNKYFSKHKCAEKIRHPIKPIPNLPSSQSGDIKDCEFQDILSRFRDGEVGDLCRKDPLIIQIGYRHFNLRRHEISKRDEIRKIVMTDMREIARLFIVFRRLSENNDSCVEDMFSRENLKQLIEAIQDMVEVERTENQEKKEKHGLKLMLDSIIMRSIKALSGYYSETLQDHKYKELKMFKIAYRHKSCELYSGARHQCHKNSKEKARKPDKLPSQSDMANLNNFIKMEIEESVDSFTAEKFAWLRSLVVARLTLYNARRGEEPARMLMKEWKDAEAGTWLPEESIESIQDDAEKYLIGQYKLVYIGGKGRKFVPVLVPNDLCPAMELLIKYRKDFGITDENGFLFATRSSMSHCSGWHAVSSVCEKAGMSIINATSNRHRLSTLYASLDMSPMDRKIFLDHMGHEESISKENYQCPQSVRTILVMGKMLDSACNGECFSYINIQFM